MAKFELGQKVYAISKHSESRRFRNYYDCPVCNNAREITINGYDFCCPHCVNDGLWATYKVSEEPFEISKVIYGKQGVKYELDYEDLDIENDIFEEDKIFENWIEAKTEAQRRNELLLHHIYN